MERLAEIKAELLENAVELATKIGHVFIATSDIETGNEK